MLVVIISVVLMCALLDSAVRGGRNDLLRIRTRRKILELRDMLQDAGLSGAANPNSEMYRFTKTILEGICRNLEEFSLYSLFLVSATRRTVGAPRWAAEIERPENSVYKLIVGDLFNCLMELHQKQNFILFPLLTRIGWMMDKRRSARAVQLNSLESREVAAILSNPKIREMDDVHQYC